MGFNTELLHGTKTGDPVTGATLTPVYQSSAFFSAIGGAARETVSQ